MPFIFKVPPQLTFLESQILNASDGEASDNFGYSVAIDGTVAVVGARYANQQGNNAGAVYVYNNIGGIWTESQILLQVSGNSGDTLGYAVAIEGNTIVATIPGSDTGLTTAHGSAIVFEYNGSSWVQVQEILPSSIVKDNRFGDSVSISGNTIVVGERNLNSARGRVYVYEKSGGTWPVTETQQIVANDGVAGDSFGEDVKVEATTIVVGAFLADVGSNTNQGAAYVFEYNGSSWVQVQKLLASNGLTNDQFGENVGLSGNYIVIGANTYDGGSTNIGAAYVFEKGASWPATETQKLTASDIGVGDLFGKGVGIDGNVIVVGSPSADISGKTDAGACYVFGRFGGTWVEKQKLIASNGLAADRFGEEIAVSGSTIIASAWFADPNGIVDAGTAYIFEEG